MSWKIYPLKDVGDPVLIIYSDGSTLAWGACAYVRWALKDGRFESKLLIAKNRIAPSKQLSIPRFELCGSVIVTRLRQTIIKEINWKFILIIHLVDLSIVRAQIQKDSYGFGTLVANRVAEIQSKTDKDEWYWVAHKRQPS